MSALLLSFLGPWQVSHANHVIPFPVRKELALLAWLATEQKSAHSRDQLCALFWIDEPMVHARNNLRVILSRLQKRLGEAAGDQPYLRVDRHTLQFNPTCDHLCDVVEFQRIVESTRRHTHTSRATCTECHAAMRLAIDLYRGEFLSGLVLENCQPFDEWLTIRRTGFQRDVVEMLQELLGETERQAVESVCLHLSEARRYAQRLVELDPLNEAAHRQLMRILVANNERNAALAQFATLQQTLQTELAVEPEAETLALYEQIRRSTPSASVGEIGKWGDRGHFSPLHPLTPSPLLPISSPPHNLPHSLTPFIGRGGEIEQLRQRLSQPRYRLITLSGAGGIGKTRLAIEAARASLAGFSDGVYLVGLTGIHEARLVPTAIVSALRLTLTNNNKSAYEQLIDILRQKRMLLILDNLEQLLPKEEPNDEPKNEIVPAETEAQTVIDLIIDILHYAPGVVLLVTSRERLNLQSEDLFLLDGLPLPANSFAPSLDQAESFAALQLFSERALAQNKKFALTPENLTAVLQLCRVVDGIPLAIELATTWLNRMSIYEIAEEITRNIELLASSQRDIPAHHRSMRIVFETSWRLLTPAEQHLLAQLSIFSGGFSLEAAKTICGASKKLLTQLQHKSMLRNPEAERYTMHELLRQFAAEKMEIGRLGDWEIGEQRLETGERRLEVRGHATRNSQLASRHSHYYLTLVAGQEDALYRQESLQAQALITADIDNVRAGWQWAIVQTDVAGIDAACEGLARYYEVIGLAQEGERVFRQTSEMVRAQVTNMSEPRTSVSGIFDTNPPPTDIYGSEMHTLAKVLVIVAKCLTMQSRFIDAETIASEALTLAELSDTPSIVAQAHRELGFVFLRRNEFSLAKMHYTTAYEVATLTASFHVALGALVDIAFVTTIEADFPLAERFYTEALQLSREKGLLYCECSALLGLAKLNLQRGNHLLTIQWGEEALRSFQMLGTQRQHSMVLDILANAWSRLGDFSKANNYYQLSLKLARQYGNRVNEVVTLCNLSVTSDIYGDYEQALQWMHQAYGLYDELNFSEAKHTAEMNLSLQYHHIGEQTTAYHFGQLALENTRQAGDRLMEGYAWTIWGHSLLALDKCDEAAHAYQQALSCHQTTGVLNLCPEAWAGLARVALANDDLAEAFEQVKEILRFLEGDTLEAAEEPARVYLTCYQVLQRVGDPRAKTILQQAYAHVQERAAKTQDEKVRNCFLHNVVAHRQIVAAYETSDSIEEPSARLRV